MALHGVVYKETGEKIDIVIGEKETDSVFVINDLLPHLGKNERKKNADEFVDGENMDLLVGNRTKQGEEKEAVKAYIAQLLKIPIRSKKKILFPLNLSWFRQERLVNAV